MTDYRTQSDTEVKPLLPKELLDGNDSYIIPMYQRNYAWGRGEIEQLIVDIRDAQQSAQLNSQAQQGSQTEDANSDDNTPKGRNYYLGTLVVFEKPDTLNSHRVFEVIDGQQRFTTLTLLIIYLKKYFKAREIEGMEWYEHQNLIFESRPKSTQALNTLLASNIATKSHLNNDSLHSAIIEGYAFIEDIIQSEFLSSDDDVDAQIDNLKEFSDYLFNHVQIARVPVPEETDLNHYFEVMNNRGEQLEKHEIIKARMLSAIENTPDAEIEEEIKFLVDNEHLSEVILTTDYKRVVKAIIHDIWEACANMNKYVQYGFNPTLREKLFSSNLTKLQPEDFDSLFETYHDSQTDNDTGALGTTPSLLRIIEKDFPKPLNPNNTDKSNKDDAEEETYYSLVNFSNFLLHVLRIMVNTDVIETGMSLDIALDDKQLLPQFDSYILDEKSLSKIKVKDEQVTLTPFIQVKDFIYTLLKCKFLFDHYIIKRNTQDTKGHWTLEKLTRTKTEGKKNSYYKSTFEEINSDLIMLQSAFHVSTPTMNYKHWLNATLYYTFDNYDNSEKFGLDATDYLQYLEWLARAFMLRRHLAGEPDDYYKIIYNTEEDTPLTLKSADTSPTLNDATEQVKHYLRYGHIRNIFVFNYLDYLLWKQATVDKKIDSRYKEFTFTARSSIEHFYPQNKRDDNVFANDKSYEESLLHSFGNLCLISHSLNSRVSNDMPDVKVKYFDDKKQVDSLKLLKMIECIKGRDTIWDKTTIVQHENDMLQVLSDGLQIELALDDEDTSDA